MSAPVPRVDISILSRGAALGSGGQGKVAEVKGLRISGQWPAALKTYSAEIVPLLDAAALEAIIRFPKQLSPADNSWLYSSTAWPAVLVEDSGRACGFLMRRVPPEYHFGFQTQTQGTKQRLADLAFLLNPDAYVRSAGLSVSDQDRIRLLEWLALALSQLHALGVTVGDLSPKNLLFSLAPAPSCFIIDCDAMRVQGETVLKQVQTPDWEVPAGEATATPAADAYKFGLLAIRLFARDQSSRDPAALAALSAELGRLATFSQHPDVGLRPAPGAWVGPLRNAALQVPGAPAAVPVLAATDQFTPPASPVGGPAAGASGTWMSVSAPPVSEREVQGGSRERRSRPAAGRPPARRLVPVLAAAGVLVAGALVGVFVHAAEHPASSQASQTLQASHHSPGGSGASPGTRAQGASSEAAQVNNLLNNSATSRVALQTAVNDIGSCSNVSAAVTAIQNVASQRSTELRDATALQTGALPNGAALKADLLSALNYSLRADRDFLRWGQQQLTGCTDPAPVTSAYTAGFDASKRAGTAKGEFLRLWNPIAAQQGLPARSGNFI
jgi:hypothetical protein